MIFILNEEQSQVKLNFTSVEPEIAVMDFISIDDKIKQEVLIHAENLKVTKRVISTLVLPFY